MRKVVVTLTVLVLLVVLIGADIRRTNTNEVKTIAKKPCYGYTIIEFGKGLDCNGDTVKLVRVDGIQRMERELASAE